MSWRPFARLLAAGPLRASCSSAPHSTTTARALSTIKVARRTTPSVLQAWCARPPPSRSQPFSSMTVVRSQRTGSTAALPYNLNPYAAEAQSAPAVPVAESNVEPRLTNPQVATYLLVIAGMVFSIVVVGGLTRLTESGLSITEWNVVGGVLPPLGAADWESEFSKYRASPEWRLYVALLLCPSLLYTETDGRLIPAVDKINPLPCQISRRFTTGSGHTASLVVSSASPFSPPSPTFSSVVACQPAPPFPSWVLEP